MSCLAESPTCHDPNGLEPSGLEPFMTQSGLNDANSNGGDACRVQNPRFLA